VCQSLNQIALEKRIGQLERTGRFGKESSWRICGFWIQQHAKPVARPICFASAKAPVAGRESRYPRAKLQMDIYGTRRSRKCNKFVNIIS